MPMCVFVAHVLYLQCMLGPRARTGRHVELPRFPSTDFTVCITKVRSQTIFMFNN